MDCGPMADSPGVWCASRGRAPHRSHQELERGALMRSAGPASAGLDAQSPCCLRLAGPVRRPGLTLCTCSCQRQTSNKELEMKAVIDDGAGVDGSTTNVAASASRSPVRPGVHRCRLCGRQLHRRHGRGAIRAMPPPGRTSRAWRSQAPSGRWAAVCTDLHAGERVAAFTPAGAWPRSRSPRPT